MKAAKARTARPGSPRSARKRKAARPWWTRGRLRGSIGYEASPASVSVGSNLVYARIHQLGGKAGRKHAVTLPPRPYLGFSEEDIKEARAILAEHLAAAFRGTK